jgi:hypothetical protein
MQGSEVLCGLRNTCIKVQPCTCKYEIYTYALSAKIARLGHILRIWKNTGFGPNGVQARRFIRHDDTNTLMLNLRDWHTSRRGLHMHRVFLPMPAQRTCATRPLMQTTHRRRRKSRVLVAPADSVCTNGFLWRACTLHKEDRPATA